MLGRSSVPNNRPRVGWLKKSTSSYKLEDNHEEEAKLSKQSKTNTRSRSLTATSSSAVAPRTRSFTLSASTPDIDAYVRKEQFARDKASSEPSIIIPKSIDEVWDEVQENWDEYSKKSKWLGNVLYKRGIPSSRRASVWLKLSKLIPNTALLHCSQEEIEGPEHSCLYKKLLEIPDTFHEQQIRADITRTFPTEQNIFAPEFQQGLFNVLKAFSLYDQEVGYCQGLSFVAALLLMHLQEEPAFFLLMRLLKGHNFRSFYTEDMNGVRLRMYQVNKITQSLFPKMYKHMEDLGISVAVVTTPWFMTAFGYQLPLDVALRVTDVMLYEGIPALFRIALAILVLCEKEILELNVDGVMDYFRSDLREKFTDPQQLMTTAYAVNVSSSELDKLEAEFRENELTAEKIESEFDHKSEEDILRKKKHFALCKVLVDSHELKEHLAQKNAECNELNKQLDGFRTKAEGDKVALIGRLGEVLDKMNTVESDNEYLHERVNILEEQLDDHKKKCDELTTCNAMMAEEIVKLKKKLGDSIKKK